MDRVCRALSRRRLLRLAVAVPFLRVLEQALARLLGWGSEAAVAAAPLPVAKVSEMKQAWSSARFTYRLKVHTKDVYNNEVVGEESIPGLVIRLPEELAAKRGGGTQGKFYVIDLHCSHERCVTTYLTDKREIRHLVEMEAKNPVVYCPCHRSVFDVAMEGKPLRGPAKEPLWQFQFEIKGDDLVVTGVDPRASQWQPGRPGGLMGEYPARPGEPGL